MTKDEALIPAATTATVTTTCSLLLYNFLLLLIPINVYIGRFLWAEFQKLPRLDLDMLFLLPFVLIYLLMFCFMTCTFIGLAAHQLWKFTRYKPLLLFLMFIGASVLAPVNTWTAGEHYFHTNRTKFESAVLLARQRKLDGKSSQYADSIKVITYDPLTIIFNAQLTPPLEDEVSSEYTVYTENPEFLKCISVCNGDGYIDGGDGRVHAQIDKNWWTCFMNWMRNGG